MAKNEINPLDAILSQYEKNSEKGGGSKPKVSNEERLKKYFTEKLRQGQKTAEKTFRILPSTDPTKSPFVETYYHEMNVNGKYEKIILQESIMLLRELTEITKIMELNSGDLSTNTLVMV
jgi:hypothetical protein